MHYLFFFVRWSCLIISVTVEQLSCTSTWQETFFHYLVITAKDLKISLSSKCVRVCVHVCLCVCICLWVCHHSPLGEVNDVNDCRDVISLYLCFFLSSLSLIVLKRRALSFVLMWALLFCWRTFLKEKRVTQEIWQLQRILRPSLHYMR